MNVNTLALLSYAQRIVSEHKGYVRNVDVGQLQYEDFTDSWDVGFMDARDSLYRSLLFLLERIGAQALLSEFKAGYLTLPNSHYLIPNFDADDVVCPVLDFFASYLEICSCLLLGEEFYGPERDLLDKILRETGTIIYNRELVPSNEAQVKKAIRDILVHVFSRVATEIPIAKSSKTYKPDLGVPSLKTAIEYKFVTSEEKAKTAIGEIYEDVLAYSGSEDWQHFYAVLYMDQEYLTQAQIDKDFEFEGSAAKTWKIFRVFGKVGAKEEPRKMKSRKSKTANGAADAKPTASTHKERARPRTAAANDDGSL